MKTKVNGGVQETRFSFRVGSETVARDVESASLVDGLVVIGDTATVAKVGDLFRAQNGPLIYQEIPIVAVTTNSFSIATTSLPDVADTFFVLRYASQRVDDQGSQVVTVTQGPVQFVLNTVDTEVSRDTAVPANSVPLPVIPLGAAGTLIDFATQTTLAALNTKVITVDTDDVTVTSSVLPTGAATEATLLSIDGKLTSPIAVTGPLTDAELRAVAVPISAASLPLPTGAATEATLASIDTKLTSPLAVTGPLTDTELRAVAVPVSAASLPLPTGAATEATLASIDGKTPTLGQALATASVPVVLTAAQITTLTPLATVTADQGAAGATAWLVDGSAVTQPISAAALPLPSGAATEATLASIDTKLTAPLSTTQGGKAKVNLARNDYSGVNVTTGAYVQLIASTAATGNMVEIFDSSGQTLVFAVGAAASEVDQFYINPGGNGQVPLAIPSGSRVSIKAVSATASAGYINLTIYS